MDSRCMELAGLQMNRTQIAALLALAVIVWGLWLLFAGVPVGMEHLAPFSGTVSVVVLIMAGFNKWFWKWKIFHGWLVVRPVFTGTWKAELVSNYVLPETGVKIPPIPAYLVVRQTYLNVSVRLFSAETSSRLLAGQLQQSDDGEWVFYGVYWDTPRVAVRDRSQIHHGAVELRLGGADQISQLEGHYWTDRGTMGDIHARSCVDALCSSFDDARRVCP